MSGERALHDQFSAYLRKQGLPFSHSRMDKPTSQTCGDPDFAVYRNGKVSFVEFKHNRNKPSPAQVKRFDELAAAGCTVRLAYDVACAIAHIESELDLSSGVEGHAQDGARPGMGSRLHSAELESVRNAGRNHRHRNLSPVSENQASPAQIKFYIANSRDIGAVVVARNLEGHWGAVRVASASDQRTLPRFTGVFE